MSVVLRYARKSAPFILLVVLLLIGKVVSDLTLPLYTSRIVNIGIQQGGLEHTVPSALGETTFKALSSIADESTRSILEASYRFEPDTHAIAAYVLTDDARVDETMMSDLLATLSMGTLASEANQSLRIQAALSLISTEYERLGMPMGTIRQRYIIRTGLMMLLISALGMVASMLVSLFASRIAAALGKDLRSALFAKTVSSNQEEIERFSTARLDTRSTNDIQQIQQSFVMILRVVVFAPLMALGGLFRVLQTNSSMSWTIGVGILAVLTVVMTMFVLAMPRFKRLQILVDSINRIVRETLNGLQVIRAFNTQDHERQRFAKANDELTATSLFVNRAMSAMMPAMMLIMNLTTILIVSKGGQHIAQGTMQVGDMMAFIQYAMLIIMSFLMISMLTIMLPRAAVSATRIKEVLDTPFTITQPDMPIALPDPLQGRIVFDRVSFSYPKAEAQALSDISFSAEPGSVTAIVGSTGSGKSTLLSLLLRFHDIASGSITIDGVDIREAELSSLRSKIGYVPQRALLFSGTIRSNIAFGKSDLDEAAVAQSADLAMAGTFIGERNEGYDAPVSQGGTNVSGGQRQRLCIARAIVGSPPILLFDDSFSALDYRTERQVRQNLRDHLGGSTVLIVAQRISSILHADQILVLDEGRLVGSGSHRYLMEHCPVYRQIASSQLSPQEIEAYGTQ